MTRAFVVTETEMMEMLDRVEAVAYSITERHPYSQVLLHKVAEALAAIMRDDREFEI